MEIAKREQQNSPSALPLTSRVQSTLKSKASDAVSPLDKLVKEESTEAWDRLLKMVTAEERRNLESLPENEKVAILEQFQEQELAANEGTRRRTKSEGRRVKV
jgi:hypothetical protein